jgi:hypothetical protein
VEKNSDALRQRAKISHDGRFCAAVTPSDIVFFGLDHRQAVRSLPNPGFRKGMGFVSDLTLSRHNRLCLFTYLPQDERAWEDQDHSNRLALYDLDRNSLAAIDTKLPLGGMPSKWRSFHVPKNAWSEDDRCFMVNVLWRQGGQAEKQFLCQLDPWSALCLDDHFGGEIRQIQFSKSGNFIAVAKAGEAKGIYVAEIARTPDEHLRLGQPAKVLDSVPAGWFWAPNAPQILVFNKGKFEPLDVRTMLTPASPATRSPWPSP